MTPWEDLFFVINNLLLGEEPVSSVLLIIQLIILMTFLSVDRRFHPPGRNQRGLRSIHTLVLLSHWTKGQFGRIGALVNTGRAGPRAHWYLIRSLDRYFLVLIEKATVFQRPGGKVCFEFWHSIFLNCHQNLVQEPVQTLSSISLCFQTADAVYDAKYKQLAASPGCRKPGLQELMQYEMNTWYPDILISWYPISRYPQISSQCSQCCPGCCQEDQTLTRGFYFSKASRQHKSQNGNVS